MFQIAGWFCFIYSSGQSLKLERAWPTLIIVQFVNLYTHTHIYQSGRIHEGNWGKKDVISHLLTLLRACKVSCTNWCQEKFKTKIKGLNIPFVHILGTSKTIWKDKLHSTQPGYKRSTVVIFTILS